MRQYLKVLIKRSLGLVAAMAMAGVAQASAAFLPIWQSSPKVLSGSKIKQDWHQSGLVEKAKCIRLVLLAQKNEPAPEKLKSPPRPHPNRKK